MARTSTLALNNATLGHAVALANKGWKQALADDRHLAAGLNVAGGKITYEAVARDQNLSYTSTEEILGL